MRVCWSAPLAAPCAIAHYPLASCRMLYAPSPRRYRLIPPRARPPPAEIREPSTPASGALFASWPSYVPPRFMVPPPDPPPPPPCRPGSLNRPGSGGLPAPSILDGLGSDHPPPGFGPT
jgi:hypothetical protein